MLLYILVFVAGRKIRSERVDGKNIEGPFNFFLRSKYVWKFLEWRDSEYEMKIFQAIIWKINDQLNLPYLW